MLSYVNEGVDYHACQMQQFNTAVKKHRRWWKSTKLYENNVENCR